MSTVDEPLWVSPDAGAVAAALAGIGVPVQPSQVALLPRDNRFAARIPGNLIAWFPTDATGLGRLDREARALDLIQRYCRFLAPQVIHQSTSGWQLRHEVPGTTDPFAVYHRVRDDQNFAARLGGNFGRLLADQHLSIPSSELGAWLLPRPGWPLSISEIAEGLPHVTDDRDLIDSALALLAHSERAEAQITDRVLAHTDFGFHNMVVSPDGAVIGVFDYDEASLTDRHYDFRYLLLDDKDDTLLVTAIEAYEAAGGMAIDTTRVCLLNAASAIGFLAWRGTADPEAKPAGRTLAEDLRWTRMAIERVS